MRKALLSALISVAVLSGCQSIGSSPYQYRFADAQGARLCLVTEPASAEGIGMQVSRALEEKGFQVQMVNPDSEADCTSCVHFTAELGDWMGPRIQSATMSLTRKENNLKHVVTVKADVRDAISFGAPIDQEIILIRSLVDQLFPHPIPWNE